MWAALLGLLDRAKGAIIGAAAIAVAALSVYAAGRSNGKRNAEVQAERDRAQANLAEANEIIQATEDRQHVEIEVITTRSSRPSTERLRDDWSRD